MKFLELGEIRELLMGVQYRPGWAISAQHRRLGPVLCIDTEGEDANDQRQMVFVHHEFPAAGIRDAEHLDDLLVSITDQVALHESREWLRRDGKPIRDPHVSQPLY